MERPIIYAISSSHLSEPSSSEWASHFNIAQKTKAVKKDDMAYTSASSEENQKESENAKARLPTMPLPMITIVLPRFGRLSGDTIFLAMIVIVQNRNSTVKLLDSADTKLTM